MCAALARHRSYLNTKPQSLLTSFAASAKVTALLAALSSRGGGGNSGSGGAVSARGGPVDSLAKLRARWAVEPTFLLVEYLAWVQPQRQNEVKRAWPPV